MFVALIVVSGLISVPIPFTQVEISLQTATVLAAGMILGGADGAIASLVYILMGLVGLPVFTKGGGLGYVVMPSFGYLIGFPVGAFITGALCGRMKRVSRVKAFASALVGMIPVYLIGATYQVLILYYYTGSTLAAAIGGLPAIGVLALKDAALCFLTARIYPSLSRLTERRKGILNPNDKD